MKPEIYTIIARDSRTGSRDLMAELHSSISGVPPKAQLQSFEQRMFDANIRTGLFITKSHMVVVLDTLTSMQDRENRYKETPLELDELFRRAGDEFLSSGNELDKIHKYLQMLPRIWAHCLPVRAMEAMMPEVVGLLHEAELETYDGIYTTDFAATA